MRNLNLKIDVSDEEAAAIEAELRSGEFACVSEMVRTAVRTYLDRRHLSDTRSIARDVAHYRQEIPSRATLIEG